MGTSEERAVRIGQFVMPSDANAMGTLFGGRLVAWMDLCGSMAAMRHAGAQVVTAAIDSLSFRRPIRVGQTVWLTAAVTWVGRTSMEVRVVAEAEDLRSRERGHAATAYLTFVAVDDEGRPRPVPPLAPDAAEAEAERRVAARRRNRLGDGGGEPA